MSTSQQSHLFYAHVTALIKELLNQTLPFISAPYSIEVLCENHSNLTLNVEKFISALQTFLLSLATATPSGHALVACSPSLALPEPQQNEAERNRPSHSPGTGQFPVNTAVDDHAINGKNSTLGIHTASEVETDSIVRLVTHSTEEVRNFPSLLQRACELGAERAGVFKIIRCDELSIVHPPPDQMEDRVSLFTVSRLKNGTYQLKSRTARANIQFETNKTSSEPSSPPLDKKRRGCSLDDGVFLQESVDRFAKLLKDTARLKEVRYCVDLDAHLPELRARVGLPQTSSIWPLVGNRLDDTKDVVPGLHYPFAYKSHQTFGAPFACHIEDFHLISLNSLYWGRKVWIIVEPQDQTRLEDQLKGDVHPVYQCTQKVRHSCVYIPQRKLKEWGIRYHVISQLPGETIVVLPHVYHQGFSVGSTLAEAVNYAPSGWNTAGYIACNTTCPNPIPISKVEFLDKQQRTQAAFHVTAGTGLAAHSENELGRDLEGGTGPGQDQNTSKYRFREPKTTEEPENQARKSKQASETSILEKQKTLQRLASNCKDEKRNHGTSVGKPRNHLATKTSQTQSDEPKTRLAVAPEKRHLPSDENRPLKRPRFSTRETGGGSTSPASTVWQAWDARRTGYQQIRAVELWLRFQSADASLCTRSGRPHNTALRHYDILTTMVLAVGSCYAFHALQQVLIFVRQQKFTFIHDILDPNLATVVKAVDSIDSADNLSCYGRRYGLAQIARSFDDRARDLGGPAKVGKARAYASLIEDIWGISIPSGMQGQRLTKRGLLTSTDPTAVQWNRSKMRLSKMIAAGRRWWELQKRFGELSILLIPRNWAIGEPAVVVSDKRYI